MHEMINTDIQIKEQNYRGNRTFTVKWRAGGIADQCDFDTKEEASAFVASLEDAGLKPGGSTESDARLQGILDQLEISHDELNAFLADLAEKAPNGLRAWLSYVSQSVVMKEKLNALAFNQSISAEEYLEKLLRFKGADLDKVYEVYDNHMAGSRLTEKLLNDYVDRLRADEEDEDELEFMERKLRRFLEAFDFNFKNVDDDSLDAYVKDTKGSPSVKARLLDTLIDFKTFADATAEE